MNYNDTAAHERIDDLCDRLDQLEEKPNVDLSGAGTRVINSKVSDPRWDEMRAKSLRLLSWSAMIYVISDLIWLTVT